MKRIVFQGDSITDAWRSVEDLHLGTGYPVLVAGELGMKYPGKYEFINRGISGNRIIDLYARVKRDIINLKPDILSILIGVNDVWHELDMKNGVDAEKFYVIYSMLIEEIKQVLPEIRIIIMEPFVLKGTATEEKWYVFDDEVKKRAQKAYNVAKKYGLEFVKLQEKFDAAVQVCPPEYWLIDGVHPSVAGHGLIKEEWLKIFNKSNS